MNKNKTEQTTTAEPIVWDFDADLADLNAARIKDDVRSLVLGYEPRVGAVAE